MNMKSELKEIKLNCGMSYVGHIKSYNRDNNLTSYIIYHGVENGKYIFTYNLMSRYRFNDIVIRHRYAPRKIYKSKKGEYVKLNGFRVYFKDLIQDKVTMNALFEGK